MKQDRPGQVNDLRRPSPTPRNRTLLFPFVCIKSALWSPFFPFLYLSSMRRFGFFCWSFCWFKAYVGEPRKIPCKEPYHTKLPGRGPDSDSQIHPFSCYCFLSLSIFFFFHMPVFFLSLFSVSNITPHATARPRAMLVSSADNCELTMCTRIETLVRADTQACCGPLCADHQRLWCPLLFVAPSSFRDMFLPATCRRVRAESGRMSPFSF